MHQLKKVFENIPEIQEVYLFGSIAKNDHLPWSDIDLLLISENPNKIRIIMNPVLDEIYVNEGILISAIFEDKEKICEIGKQFKKEGKLIWAKKKNF